LDVEKPKSLSNYVRFAQTCEDVNPAAMCAHDNGGCGEHTCIGLGGFKDIKVPEGTPEFYQEKIASGQTICMCKGPAKEDGSCNDEAGPGYHRHTAKMSDKVTLECIGQFIDVASAFVLPASGKPVWKLDEIKKLCDGKSFFEFTPGEVAELNVAESGSGLQLQIDYKCVGCDKCENPETQCFRQAEGETWKYQCSCREGWHMRRDGTCSNYYPSQKLAWNETKTVPCPENQALTLMYGRILTKSCLPYSVFTYIGQQCAKYGGCDINPSKMVPDTAHPGCKPDTVEVFYQCQTQHGSLTRLGEAKTIDCGSKVIGVHGAWAYGGSCYSEVLNEIAPACDGRNSCQIVGQRPYGECGKSDYLLSRIGTLYSRLWYECQEPTFRTVVHGAGSHSLLFATNAAITCPENQVVSFSMALVYKDYPDTECPRVSVVDALNKQCKDKNMCHPRVTTEGLGLKEAPCLKMDFKKPKSLHNYVHFTQKCEAVSSACSQAQCGDNNCIAWSAFDNLALPKNTPEFYQEKIASGGSMCMCKNGPAKENGSCNDEAVTGYSSNSVKSSDKVTLTCSHGFLEIVSAFLLSASNKPVWKLGETKKLCDGKSTCEFTPNEVAELKVAEVGSDAQFQFGYSCAGCSDCAEGLQCFRQKEGDDWKYKCDCPDGSIWSFSGCSGTFTQKTLLWNEDTTISCPEGEA